MLCTLIVIYACSYVFDSDSGKIGKGQDRIQLLRNIEVKGKYKKYLIERYMDRIYVLVRPGFKSYVRFTISAGRFVEIWAAVCIFG